MTNNDSKSSELPALDNGKGLLRLRRHLKRFVPGGQKPDPTLRPVTQDIPGPRTYPVLTQDGAAPTIPISFVVVHFCGDYFHNLLKSPCVLNPLNQLVTVDNRWGHRYDTLSAAITSGLQATLHDLVVVVHEDVVLPPGWHSRLEQSLESLDKADPDWGLVGSVGWDEAGAHVGHWSDPHRYRDTLGDQDFGQVARLDEQILIFRKSSGLEFDEMLPSIHNIGRDLTATLAEAGRKTYAVNAPTIHKYADENGKLIGTAKASVKIRTRHLPANLAEWKCSNEYLYAKWPQWQPKDEIVEDLTPSPKPNAAPPPVILLARGGSGSRLLSALAADLGLFLGNDVNASGDAMDMTEAVYRAVFATYQSRVDWQRAQAVPRLRAHAAKMLEQGKPQGLWGFKLPENLLILPLIAQAFPDARYVHLIRDPLATCLRRTHMTARFDNAIGRTAIRAAYAYCNRSVWRSLEDSPALHMAYTTRHQIESARSFAQKHLKERYTEIRFEDLINAPLDTGQTLAQWLDVAPQTDTLSRVIDPKRAAQPKKTYDAKTARRTAIALHGLRAALNYS